MSKTTPGSNKDLSLDGYRSFASQWIARPVVWLGGAISAILIFVVFVITIYSIALRYFLNAPLLWADEVTGWMLVGIVMLGIAEAYRRNDHIAIDILSSRLTGRRSKAVAQIFSDLAVLGFSAVLIQSSWHAINFAQSFGVYTDGHIVIETWYLQTPILIGGVMMGLLSLVRLAERIFRGTAT